MKLSDFNTLAEAKVYEQTQPRLIHRDTMNSLLASASLYVPFQALAQDNTNPFQNLIAAFLDSTEYNFMIGNSTGDRQIAALDTMIAAGGDLGNALAQLRPVILSIANPVIKPFENATLHDWKVANDDPTRFKPVSNTAIEQGYLKITTTADCEAHRPGVYKQVHGEYIRVTNFPVVSVAGDYIALVTNHRDLFVDDAYGVVA